MTKEMAKRNATGGTMKTTIEQALMEAEELRRMLASTYAGDRFLRIFGWSMAKCLFDVVEDLKQWIYLSRGFATVEDSMQ